MLGSHDFTIPSRSTGNQAIRILMISIASGFLLSRIVCAELDLFYKSIGREELPKDKGKCCSLWEIHPSERQALVSSAIL